MSSAGEALLIALVAALVEDLEGEREVRDLLLSGQTKPARKPVGQIESAPGQPFSQTDIGKYVFHDREGYGKGRIIEWKGGRYPVMVQFDNGHDADYTADGRLYRSGSPALVRLAEGGHVAKPFGPDDVKVAGWDSQGEPVVAIQELDGYLHVQRFRDGDTLSGWIKPNGDADPVCPYSYCPITRQKPAAG
jgi:hypothetical protein